MLTAEPFDLQVVLSGTPSTKLVITTMEAVKRQEHVNMSTCSVPSSDEVPNDTHFVSLFMPISYEHVLQNYHVFGTGLLLTANCYSHF